MNTKDRISFLESSIAAFDGQIKGYAKQIAEEGAHGAARLQGAMNDVLLTIGAHKHELAELKPAPKKLGAA